MVDEKWFEGDKPSKKGKEFLEKIAGFVSKIKDVCGSSIAEIECGTLPVNKLPMGWWRGV